MGMSASQARLLTLTSRLSDLELQAQVISNSKIRLSMESEQVATAYSDALDKQKLTFKSTDSNGDTVYTNLTANMLMTYDSSSLEAQRVMKDTYGRILVSEDTASNFRAATDEESFLNGFGYTSISPDTKKTNLETAAITDIASQMAAIESTVTGTTGGYSSTMTSAQMAASLSALSNTLGSLTGSFTNSDLTTYVTKEQAVLNPLVTSLAAGGTSAISASDLDSVSYALTGISTGDIEALLEDGTLTSKALGSYTYDSTAVTYYENLYNEINDNGYVATSDDNLSSNSWLYDELLNGNLSLYKYSSANSADADSYGFKSESWSSGDTSIVQETDDTETAKAEATYESESSKIETKDKKFDLELSNINTEHTAVQTEIDSVKKVIDKNIDRSFKIFNA